MTIFCNTTPFIALSCVGQLDLLPRLFGRVHVVDAVVEECAAGGPIAVPDLRTLPWIAVVPGDPKPVQGALLELDHGERLTIYMALLLGADRVLIDEKLGRQLAEHLGLRVTGTLGVLLKARHAGWIPSFAGCVQAMRDQGIRFNLALVRKLAARVGETV